MIQTAWAGAAPAFITASPVSIEPTRKRAYSKRKEKPSSITELRDIFADNPSARLSTPDIERMLCISRVRARVVGLQLVKEGLLEVETVSNTSVFRMRTSAEVAYRPPQKGGRPAKTSGAIRAFFEANPDEELTIADMALKFGAPRELAKQAAIRLRKLGELEARMEGQENVYRRAG